MPFSQMITRKRRCEDMTKVLDVTDLESPRFSPGFMLKAIKELQGVDISPRMLSNTVLSTIGEAVTPADGYGSKRSFSFMDASLLLSGRDLQDLGLNPARTRSCVEAMRPRFAEMVSWALRQSQPEEDHDSGLDLFLVADFQRVAGFVPRVTTRSQLHGEQEKGSSLPLITYYARS